MFRNISQDWKENKLDVKVDKSWSAIGPFKGEEIALILKCELLIPTKEYFFTLGLDLQTLMNNADKKTNIVGQGKALYTLEYMSYAVPATLVDIVNMRRNASIQEGEENLKQHSYRLSKEDLTAAKRLIQQRGDYYPIADAIRIWYKLTFGGCSEDSLDAELLYLRQLNPRDKRVYH